MLEVFIYGLVVGYLLYPFFSVIKAIFMNAYNATYTSGCSGNCNQGRNCTCKDQ